MDQILQLLESALPTRTGKAIAIIGFLLISYISSDPAWLLGKLQNLDSNTTRCLAKASLYEALIILIMLPLFFLNLHQLHHDRSFRHRGDVDELLHSALKLISNRCNLQIEIIHAFKDELKTKKVYTRSSQEKFLFGLVKVAYDLQTIDAELEGVDVSEERTKLVSQRRILRDRMEEAKATIDKYRRENA